MLTILMTQTPILNGAICGLDGQPPAPVPRRTGEQPAQAPRAQRPAAA